MAKRTIEEETEALIEEAAEILSQARSIVILTGAGLSTASGIPDFRGPEGVWTKNPLAEMASTYSRYMSSREHRIESWKTWNDPVLRDAKPNAGHYAIEDLKKKKPVLGIITQNVDGLHNKAAAENVYDELDDREDVWEVHGHIRSATCTYCDTKWLPKDLEYYWENLSDSERREWNNSDAEFPDILCSCGEIVKLDVIYFEELLPQDIWAKAENAAWKADAMVVLGSSLTVYPVANLPRLTKSMGGKLLIFNRGNTPYDDEADLCVDGLAIEDIFPRIVERVS